MRNSLLVLAMMSRNNWRKWPAIWRITRPAAQRRRQDTMELIARMMLSGIDPAAVRLVDGNVIEVRIHRGQA